MVFGQNNSVIYRFFETKNSFQTLQEMDKITVLFRKDVQQVKEVYEDKSFPDIDTFIENYLEKLST